MLKKISILAILVVAFTLGSVSSQAQTGKLIMSKGYFSTAKWGANLSPAVYKKPIKVFYHAYIAGLQAKSDGTYGVTADMIVLKPDGSLYYTHPNLINQSSVSSSIFTNNELPLMMNIQMDATDPDGDYTFIITVTDLVSGKKGYISQRFTLTK